MNIFNGLIMGMNMVVYSVPPRFNEKLEPSLECLNQVYGAASNVQIIETLNKIKQLDMRNWLMIKPNVAFVYKCSMEKINDIHFMAEKLPENICYELKSLRIKIKNAKEKYIIKKTSLTKNKIEKMKLWLFFIEDLNAVLKLQSEKSVVFIENNEMSKWLDKVNSEINEFAQISSEIKQCLKETKEEVINNLDDIKNYFKNKKIDFNQMSRFYDHNNPELTWLFQITLMEIDAEKKSNLADVLEDEDKEIIIDQLITIFSLFEKGIMGFFLLKLIFMEYRLFSLSENLSLTVEKIYENKLNHLKNRKKESFNDEEMFNELVNNEKKVKNKISQELKRNKEDYSFIYKSKKEINNNFCKLFNINANDIMIKIKVSKENGSFLANYGDISLIGVVAKENKCSYIKTVRLNRYGKEVDISKIKKLDDLRDLNYHKVSSFKNIESFFREIKNNSIQNFIFKTTGKDFDLIYV